MNDKTETKNRSSDSKGAEDGGKAMSGCVQDCLQVLHKNTMETMYEYPLGIGVKERTKHHGIAASSLNRVNISDSGHRPHFI